MASESGFGSHNPFRRRTAAPSAAGAQAQLEPEAGAGAAPPASSFVLHADNAPLRPQAPPRPSGNDFARSLTLLPKSDAPPPATSFQKKKPVKKVRVQSPPPSSPESASAERSYPKYPLPPREEGDDSSSLSSPSLNGEAEDPFQNEAPPLPEDALASMGRVQAPQPQPLPQQYTGRGPPPNPFQKTLEDMEQAARDGGSGAAEHASPAGKGLDVEAFKKLLLTGQGPAPGPAGTSGPATLHPTGVAGDGGSMTDASSVSRQSIFENNNHSLESPRTSHEISEPEPEGDEEQRGLISPPPPKQPGSRKKLPPPPPATRHGKSIRAGPVAQDRSQALERRASGGLADASSGRRASLSPTDVNKPLPEPPAPSEYDPKESIFDKEAAGKVPEVDIDPEADVVPPPRPPTPPNTSHSSSTPVQNPTSTLRKPAPPPRRGAHARTESKPQAELPEEPPTPSRSSMDSVRSRSSSIRLSTAAPVPPPPRRPAGHRPSPSVSSPVSTMQSSAFPFPAGQLSPSSDVPGSTYAATQLATDTSSATTGSSTSLTPQQHPGVSKLTPPPPPQRNPSLRKSTASSANRPASSSSVEVPARKGGLPPPPPPRKRGSSRGSMEGSEPKGASTEGVRKASGDSFAGNVPPVAEETETVDDVTTADAAATDPSIQAMLADLDALQREVEAARAAAAGGGA
ncbi:hypothetical protein KVR01_012435 [Diaporthe batatas]|uniref:uncharacterized protein n=1 Tax=Diaporthe batatas TaxID=748121 RepID=UPI001D052394|nr:uncharacterized protein KVR01_012435 [Diaporthe batatas]KAG8157773.1 hypothetical protein KVR01_012435 [Diaporthe batatas]